MIPWKAATPERAVPSLQAPSRFEKIPLVFSKDSGKRLRHNAWLAYSRVNISSETGILRFIVNNLL